MEDGLALDYPIHGNAIKHRQKTMPRHELSVMFMSHYHGSISSY